MPLSPLTAISPVDGRYRRAVETLAQYFSESALIRYRVQVEIEYFIALCELPLPPLTGVETAVFESLRGIYRNFGDQEAEAVKAIERETNHDVKAVEYFLKERFEQLGLGAHREFIHFSLTSQDINNTAVPLSLRDAWAGVLSPLFDEVMAALGARVQEWRNVPLLARTHGQPASPTVMGKEIQVFVERLHQQRDLLAQVPFSGKFGGATGNFNAHQVAYSEVDWPAFADRLVNDVLGLRRCRVTTQIEHYDNLAAFCDGLKRLNTVLIDLSRDVWTYIAMNYFRQKIKKGEVGSSTMPHKVNPIDFENAEGNLGVANALLEHLAAKLPISRLQRDLTDSTVTRNIGVPLAHTVIALKSLLRGLDKIMIDTATISQDLEANWAVVTEGIQTVLRRVGYPNPYEALKALARTNKPIDRHMIQAFIDDLDVADDVKAELKNITPHNYTGVPLI
jgi:adenylosuccinate lyase